MNDRPTGLPAVACERFCDRLLGAARVARLAGDALAWCLRPCGAVHTLFGPAPLDVVLCDARGIARRVEAGMPSWRLASDRRCRCAWESAAGVLAALGVAPGDRLELRCRRQHGATMLEFTLALFLGLLPLVLATVQVAQLLGAANTVQLATYLAARAGSTTGADPRAMRLELARGMLAAYVPASRGGVVNAAAAMKAYAAAVRDVETLDTISVESPSAHSARSLAVSRHGRFVIPNESLQFRSADLRRANFLAIEVVHCQPLVVPLAGAAIAAALRLVDGDPRHGACLGAGRAPIAARAVIEMHSDGGVHE